MSACVEELQFLGYCVVQLWQLGPTLALPVGPAGADAAARLLGALQVSTVFARRPHASGASALSKLIDDEGAASLAATVGAMDAQLALRTPDCALDISPLPTVETPS